MKKAVTDLYEDFLENTLDEIKTSALKKITVDLFEVLDKKPQLNFNKIKTIIFDIRDYYTYFPNDEDLDSTYFDKFLEIYDCYLSAEDKLDILLIINDKKSFKRFALKHYDTLEKEFQKTIFIDGTTISELDMLEDFQYKIDCLFGTGNYRAQWWCDYNLEILVDLYKIFGENIKIFNNGIIEKYDLNQLYYLKSNDLEELLVYEITSKSKGSIVQLLTAFSKHNVCDEIFEFTKIDSVITTEKEINKVLESIKEKCLESFFDCDEYSRSFYSRIYNEILREKVDKLILSDENNVDDVFSIDYLRALNLLASYSKEELINSHLYLKSFKIFLEQFLKRYKEPVTKEVLLIVEQLFKRAINKKDIINILGIENEKTLWHFYKTDEIVGRFNIPLEMIKESNSKQYKQLKGEWIEKNARDDRNIVFDSRENLKNAEIILKLLKFFGYDFSKKLICLSECKVKVVLDYVSKKNQSYIDTLKEVLKYDLNLLSDSNEIDINIFLACFDMLYTQECRNITFNRVVKSINSLSYALFPSNRHIEKNLDRLNLVAKGDPLLEKIEGIKLYDKYRFRIDSSIPDIDGSYEELNYSMVDMHSSEILSNGIGNYVLPDGVRASSCLTPNGKAASCLRHGAVNPNGRFFKVEDYNGIVAYSWVWRIGDVICFDNIEVTDKLLLRENYEKELFDIYQRVASELLSITKRQENRGVKLVILGRNKIDLANRYFENLQEVSKERREQFKPKSSEELYLKDSSLKQLVLAGDLDDEIKLEEVLPIYKYQRAGVESFSKFSKEELYRRVNSIYFDYCLENNKKYNAIRDKYKSGFLGEDWFVGKVDDDNIEFYYCGEDERLFLESKDYVESSVQKSKIEVNVIHPKKEIIEHILDRKNIEVDIQNIKEYLQRKDKDVFNLLAEYYTHFSRGLENFVNILENKAITSSAYGNHPGGMGCNGRHFISVAGAYAKYLQSPTFIITSDICVFSELPSIKGSQIDEKFRDTDYPFRMTNYAWEFHVLNSISLDKVKAIFVASSDILRLAQIVYIQELFENNLPLVEISDCSYIDNDVIKKYCKMKKM